MTNQIPIELGEQYSGHNLVCPRCEDDHMHHKDVHVYDRNEDALEGSHVHVRYNEVTYNTNLKGNPSSRRSGVTILFECEHCHANPILNIIQHKGCTLLEWDLNTH